MNTLSFNDFLQSKPASCLKTARNGLLAKKKKDSGRRVQFNADYGY